MAVVEIKAEEISIVGYRPQDGDVVFVKFLKPDFSMAEVEHAKTFLQERLGPGVKVIGLYADDVEIGVLREQK